MCYFQTKNKIQALKEKYKETQLLKEAYNKNRKKQQTHWDLFHIWTDVGKEQRNDKNKEAKQGWDGK